MLVVEDGCVMTTTMMMVMLLWACDYIYMILKCFKLLKKHILSFVYISLISCKIGKKISKIFAIFIELKYKLDLQITAKIRGSSLCHLSKTKNLLHVNSRAMKV